MLQLTASCPGVMMILMGDEMWRTQGGNNNPFTQDNSISWLDWHLLDQNRAWWQRVRTLIHAKSDRY
jgi:glycogen operon protein